ncbi:MAG: hypothetical protein AAF581_07790 [Planctomycetota bacterium]
MRAHNGIFVLFFVWICLLGAPSVAAAQDDRYVLSTVTYDLSASPLEVIHRLTTQSGTLGAAEATNGLSFGICLSAPSSVLQLELGTTASTINDGFPAGFWGFQLYPEGYTVGMVYDLLGNHVLAPDSIADVAWARIDAGAPGALPSNAYPQYCDTVGTPLVELCVVAVGGGCRVPVIASGITQLPPPTTGFTRGDCYGDGVRNFIDIVSVLLAAFPPPGAQPVLGCADACDVNDDGSLNVVDAVALLNFLFGVPPVPVPGPQDCGTDSTVDTLDCLVAINCP